MHNALKTVLVAAAAVASLAAGAQPLNRIDSRDIDARQARQEQRIEAGLARGEITHHEARMLQRQQHQIARFEARAKADGRFSRDEMQRLVAMLDRADVRIRQVRHERDGHRAG